MLSSIHPLGERARNNRFSRTAAAYLAGSAAGGMAAGLLAGALGALVAPTGHPGTVAVGVAAAVCMAGAVLEARPVPALPGPRRQVNEDWLAEYRGWVYGLGFGVQLGTGVVTIVTTPLVYVMLLLAGLTGSAAIGATVGTVFGVTRALPVLAMRGVDDAERLRRVHRRIARSGEPLRRASTLVIALAALALGGAVLAGA